MDRSTKNPGPTPEHRLNVILEELQSQFRVFGEGLTDVQEKVSGISERLEKVEQDVFMVKSDVSIIKSVISVIPTLATKKDLEKVEKDVSAIKSVTPTLATKKDLERFDKLEKRLTALETR